MICGLALLFIWPEQSSQKQSLSTWQTYIDDSLGISFQYPLDWNVQVETSDIIRISPPYALAINSDFEVGRAVYGVRVMPFDAPYPMFPFELTERDIDLGLKHITSFYFQTAEFQTAAGETILVVYDIAHDNRSLLAFKRIQGRLFAIELGRYFPGTRMLADAVGFFGILSSLGGVH